VRIKRLIVEKFEMTKRWEEEVALIKMEMAHFIKFYMEVAMPQLQRIANELKDSLDS